MMKHSTIYCVLLLLATYTKFQATAAQPGMIDCPTHEQLHAGLLRWADRWPERIRVEVVGESQEGRPILLARVSDSQVPDENKQVVLLTVTHCDYEYTPITGLLKLTRWLLSDDPMSARIRHGTIVLVMPCPHPDGYESGVNKARKLNLYTAFSYEGPHDVPEAQAVFKVSEQYRPDVSWDVHGVPARNTTMWESTGFSWGCFEAHGYSKHLVAEMNRAAERAGFPIIRPGDDAGRIKVSAPKQGLRHHFYYVRPNTTIMSMLYHRYHTLAINAESGFDDSVLVRGRRLLELGLETWNHEIFPGYPTNQVGCFGIVSVSAWGETARQRRESRVELWAKANQLYYAHGNPPPARDKLMAVCATTVSAAEQWLTDKDIGAVIKGLKAHDRIDADYLADFVSGTPIAELERPHYTQGYKSGTVTDEPIEHGLALRLYIPYNDARILDARIDGHAVEPSPTDGYSIRREPGTIIQFNIPPGEVNGLHMVTCQYSSAISQSRRNGFGAEDWE